MPEAKSQEPYEISGLDAFPLLRRSGKNDSRLGKSGCRRGSRTYRRSGPSPQRHRGHHSRGMLPRGRRRCLAFHRPSRAKASQPHFSPNSTPVLALTWARKDATSLVVNFRRSQPMNSDRSCPGSCAELESKAAAKATRAKMVSVTHL